MPQRWKNTVLSLFAASLLFASCKKQSSTDTPLPSNYYPSVIINSDNQVVYAFDPVTGDKNWEFGLYNPANYLLLNPTVPIIFTPSPVVYNGSVYITYIQRDGSKTDTIYKVNGKTGKLIMKILPNKTEHFNIQATPVASGNLLYVAADNGHLFAIDTGTGVTQWEYTNTDGALISSPTIYGSNVYFASLGGTVFCVDKTNGPTATTNWSYAPKSPNDSNVKIASFVSSPAILAPYLYIGSISDSNMYCIFLNVPADTTIQYNKGLERWRYKTLGGIYSSPSAYKGTCVFGSSDFNVYCLDTFVNHPHGIITPASRWTAPVHTTSSIYSSPYVSNDVIYIGNNDYFLYALNIIDGGLKWSCKTKGLIKSSPISYNGLLYVGSEDKYLYAIDTGTGTVKWNKNLNGTVECSPVINDLTGRSYNSGISGYENGGYTLDANNQ